MYRTTRTSCISAALFALLLSAIVGCTDQMPTAELETEQRQELRLDVPERPQLAEGQSNWEAQPGKAMAPLATTDLNTLTAADLVTALTGSGTNAPVITNVTFNGAPIAGGTFSGGSGIIEFDGGIVLSSGNVASVTGPNMSDGITTNNGLPGDADLNTLIPGFETLDATVLEFDFECPILKEVSFEYVFTSDEYNEYVDSPFNDVFGFFLNGTNIALIPGTATPVAINNVNCGNPYSPPGGSNCALFRNNDLSDGGGTIDTEMDGLTQAFAATSSVNAGVNHFKLAIADAGDHVLDSNVFLKAGSFLCAPPAIEVSVDVHPTSCPNPLNVGKRGTIPVSINGTADFDVATIDPETVALEGVSATRWSLEDVTAPYTGPVEGRNDCTTDGPDGHTDLTLKFDAEAVSAALGAVADGDEVILSLTGQTLDGTDVIGGDVVWIKSKGK